MQVPPQFEAVLLLTAAELEMVLQEVTLLLKLQVELLIFQQSDCVYIQLVQFLCQDNQHFRLNLLILQLIPI